MENIKNDKQSLPTYNELVEALKDTHNLYIEAIRDKYMTYDMIRVMKNNIIFNRLKYKETIKIDENHNNIQNQSIENVEVKCDNCKYDIPNSRHCDTCFNGNGFKPK